jgi:glycosyltransferase involved in cell wall biosynthesis
VTIGCPVYNADEYLELALESLLDQSYDDYEIFISDNGSTDRTEEICRAFATRDERVRYSRSEINHGLSWNWNTLIAGARGEYYKTAAHDDLHARDYLLRTTSVLDEHLDVVLCYPKTIDIDADGNELGIHPDNLDLQQPTPHQRLAHLLRYMRFCNPIFGLMRTSVLRSTGWMRPYGKADRVLLAEMCLRGKYYEYPEPLFYRRLFSGRSLEKYTDPAELDRFHATAPTASSGYPWTRLFAAHVGAIRHAPIPEVERIRCLGALLREWRHYRGALEEASAGVRRLAQRR